MKKKPPQLFYTLSASFLYDLLLRSVTEKERNEAIQNLTLQKAEKVLLAGCGTGLDIPLFPENISLFGFDLNKAMLKQAQKQVTKRSGNVILCQAEAQALPYKNNTFDAAYLFLILSIVPKPDLLMQEVARVCKSSARVIIVDKFVSKKPNFMLNVMNEVASRVATNINLNFDTLFHEKLKGSFSLLSDEKRALFGYIRRITLKPIPSKI